ncbi:MAG: single-stranded-DNA-specific exonuclease RecJ [Chloroflexi bacterium]|nr:single-stranded-DNA-specific exonuclease RecJ [Chloroflexota bacterium]
MTMTVSAEVTAAAWSVRRRAPAAVLDEYGLDSPLLAQLLLNRGVAPADANAFLAPPAPAPPKLDAMADLGAAVRRIEAAIACGERIVVYGDYDVDGLSGSTLLALALQKVGANASVYIPHRERDGYGLNRDVLSALQADGVGLIVSVDCGVSAVAEIQVAVALGLDVVVTDHHHVPPDLPQAIAVVNPRRSDCPYPFKELSGAGVALVLARALLARRLPDRERTHLEAHLFELAMLGTVADVMPLVGENRAIVRQGLRVLNEQPGLGLAALAARARLTRPWIDAEAIAFRIAPRLNAAGRLADATLAQRLLAAATSDEASRFADDLEVLNERRRAVLSDAMERAHAELRTLGEPLPAGLVLAGAYEPGLLGLLAARLAEEVARPVAVIQRTPELCRGSVRGVPGFDTVGAVRACQHLLTTFGGHAGAAGFTTTPQQADRFREAFVAAVASMPRCVPAPLEADCRLRPESIETGLLDLLARLEPFGEGNRQPLFETNGVVVREARVVGDGHVRLRLWGKGRPLKGIMFRAGGCGPEVGMTVDVLHRVRPNIWRDDVSAELHVEAWRPSSVSAE